MFEIIINGIAQISYYALFVWAILYFMSKKKTMENGKNKQRALFYQLLLFFLLFVLVTLINEFNLSSYFILLSVVVVAGIGIYFRKQVFPYQTKCSECGRKLDFNQIFFDDSTICSSCSENDDELESSNEIEDDEISEED